MLRMPIVLPSLLRACVTNIQKKKANIVSSKKTRIQTTLLRAINSGIPSRSIWNESKCRWEKI